jgi:signal transduction histidine kinase
MAETAANQAYDAFARLARIGAGTTGGVDELLRDSGALALSALELRRVAVYRLHPSGEVVPVVNCGESALEPVGGMVWSLDRRPIFRRAYDERRAVRVEGTGEDPVLPKTLLGGLDRSADGPVVLAPLWGATTCLGFLAGEDGEFPQERLDKFSAFADVLGAFLEQWLERDRLHRLDDLKSHFIALASHELRAPVSVIHGIGVTLNQRREALADDDVARLHGVLNEQTDHLVQLISQLLDLSRLEASAIKLDRQEIPVRDRIERIVRGVVPDYAEKIDVDVPDELATVADPAAFERIVANLVTNAVRYGEPPIRIAAEQRDTHFRLRVEDHGDGVASEFVPRLFERFTRAGGQEKVSGTGLGLAIAQSYANAHGGELLYEPAQPKGARFELVLPRPHGPASET